MYIDKIAINNFKIYFGENTISFPPLSSKNVCVISGNNGYGKTTLLTALVWCLYGNQIQDVDDFFKDRVNATGGYKKYLLTCMNRHALENNQSEYSVSIDLKDVELPGIYCDTIHISRSFNLNKLNDFLTIYMDGNPSELVDEIGKQLFIQDFILPKELAKLFFFDAEKIVRLAEVQSLHEKRLFSQAYSEVLGIKKYEDLRNNLSDLMIRFRRDSASDAERKQFEELRKEINSIEHKIDEKGRKKENMLTQNSELRMQSDKLQEKLLREGNTLSISEINSLREEKTKLGATRKTLNTAFRDLFELAPFALAGQLMVQIEQQIDNEDKYNRTVISQDNIKTKIKLIVDALSTDKNKLTETLSEEIKEYYVSKVNTLAHTHLIEKQNVDQENNTLLHNFNVDETNIFRAILANLRTTYKEKLQTLNSELKSNQIAFDNVSRVLNNAESNEKDPLIREYREERRNNEESLQYIEKIALQLSHEIGALEYELISKNKKFEEIAKKIKVDRIYFEKDQLVSRLINELDEFLKRIKNLKKKSLEKRILTNAQLLMHKKNFIKRIVIEVSDDILDILLFDNRDNEIRKEDLSKGEQQLYATALLKALVEESGIQFPVIIDSPLQKFDDKHSKNVITKFYPKISKQVIILPLRNKELNRQEYKMLYKNIGCLYLIENNDDSSSFKEMKPETLFIN